MIIKNIIFDLGGVLIPLNAQATADAFKNLGAKNFDEIYSFIEQQNFFDLYDKGLITDSQFRTELRKHLYNNVTDSQIDNAWNAMLGLMPVNKIDFLKKVNENYNVYLLSNTNTIHVKKFEADHLTHYNEDIFTTYFIKAYYSCNMGMRKPDEEIFQFVIDDSNLKKDETLFIDDTAKHVKGALMAGLNAFHLDLKTDSVETLFEKAFA